MKDARVSFNEVEQAVVGYVYGECRVMVAPSVHVIMVSVS